MKATTTNLFNIVNQQFDAAPNQSDIMTQQYISILEKTNQQLSLWSNPYGILVTILSILFTVLTVVAAIIIWRQGKEQKEAFSEALKNYEKGLQENLKKIGTEAETKIQSFIDLKTKEISELSGDTKKQAKKIIKDLEKEKESISSRIQFSTIGGTGGGIVNGTAGSLLNYGPSGYAGGSGSSIAYGGATCPDCGFLFVRNNLPYYLSSSNFCPNCGKEL